MTTPAHRISTSLPIGDQARKARSDVARHGVSVWVGRRSQARKLRQLQAVLRGDGYQAHDFIVTDGPSSHVLTVEPLGPSRRAIAWWGPAS
jgi:hypothetical protein